MIRRLIASIGMILVIMVGVAVVACGGDSEKSPIPTEPSPGEGITTASGLKYIEIEAGTGPAPQKNDMVEVHYTGTLEDGTKFDSSVDRGEPISFRLGTGKVIKGWDEGIALMKEGGKAKLIIPPDLGYGATGNDTIPPNATLIFDVELVAVHPALPPTKVDEADYQVTTSGLKYYDLQVGGGVSPQAGECAVINFAGWLLDGTPLERTEEGRPLVAPIGVGRTVAGVDEGVATMKVGGNRQFVLPPALAFGEQGAPPEIPPNATLIAEVELLGIVPVFQPTARTEVAEGDYVTTPSGLKYYDIKIGEGALLEKEQFVVLHYTGWLVDGTEFGGSLQSGQPLDFVIGAGEIILGVDEGVMTMRLGGKRQIVIPPELGFGDQANGPIPANSTLIFEVELVYVQ